MSKLKSIIIEDEYLAAELLAKNLEDHLHTKLVWKKQWQSGKQKSNIDLLIFRNPRNVRGFFYDFLCLITKL